jgi:Lipocalin-like domain
VLRPGKKASAIYLLTKSLVMKKLVFGLLSLTLLATACKKSKDEPAVDVTKENIAGTYKLTSVKASANGSQEVDFDYREACEKDDTYKLNADNTFLYTDAGTVCGDPYEFSGDWTLEGNVISFYQDSGNITKLTASTLEVTNTYTDGGTTMVVRSTYQRQ